MAVQTQPQGWHVGQWGLWGWIETGLKGIGIAAGLVAFLTSNAANELTLGGHPHLAAVILLALVSLVMVALPVFRFQQKEIIALIFSISNALGHIGLLVALLREPTNTTLGLVFAVFFVLGELAKQRFLALSGFTERGQTTSQMLRFSRSVAVTYAVLIGLLLF